MGMFNVNKLKVWVETETEIDLESYCNCDECKGESREIQGEKRVDLWEYIEHFSTESLINEVRSRKGEQIPISPQDVIKLINERLSSEEVKEIYDAIEDSYHKDVFSLL